MIEAFRMLLDRLETSCVEIGRERALRVAAETKVDRQSFAVPDVIALVEHMASDRKIDAIRVYRNLTGRTLKDSKDAIETVTNRLRPRT